MRATASSMVAIGVCARMGLNMLTARGYQLLQARVAGARMSSHMAPRKSLLSRNAKKRRQEPGPGALGCTEREQFRPQGQPAGDEKRGADQPARARLARPGKIQG